LVVDIDGHPDMESVARRAKSLRLRRTAGIVIAGVVGAVAVIAPLMALSPLGREDGTAADGSAPSRLIVRCDGSTTGLDAQEVQSRADGVHVLVHNLTAADLLFLAGPMGVTVEPGRHEVVLAEPPGEASVACQDPRDDTGDAQYSTFTIVDREGMWFDPTLDCDAPSANEFGETFIDAADNLALTEYVRSRSTGLTESDELSVGGYRSGSRRWVLVEREDQTIASVEFMQLDGWEVREALYCEGSGVDFQP
jgi:hypothetical protein